MFSSSECVKLTLLEKEDGGVGGEGFATFKMLSKHVWWKGFFLQFFNEILYIYVTSIRLELKNIAN